MRGAIARTTYDCKGLAASFWHGQSMRAERSYGRVHVCMSTPLRTGAALDMLHFDGQEMRALSEVPYVNVVSTF